MPGLPAAFTPDHLSLLLLQTLNRLRNLAASFSAALDDEFSRRQAQPRLAEEGLSPQSRDLLLVGSRQLLHQALVFLDEPSSELSDSRSLALILLHIQRTNKAGVLGKSDHDDCLGLSVLCDLVHNHGLPHILDRLLGLLTPTHCSRYRTGCWWTFNGKKVSAVCTPSLSISAHHIFSAKPCSTF
jgi:hypothetical protein